MDVGLKTLNLTYMPRLQNCITLLLLLAVVVSSCSSQKIDKRMGNPNAGTPSATTPAGTLRMAGPTESNAGAEILMSWNTVDSAESYNLVVASDRSCSKPEFELKGIVATSQRFVLSKPGVYFVCVSAYTKSGKAVAKVEDSYKISVTNSSERASPVVGTFSASASVTSSGFILNWGAATDDVTAASSLEYFVCSGASVADIDTVAECDAATEEMPYQANILTLPISAKAPNTAYYYNVIVRNGAGKKAIYTAKTQATLPVPAGPPALTALNVAQVEINMAITVDFPADASDYSSLVIRRINGSQPPTCSTGVVVATLSSFNDQTVLDSTAPENTLLSYRACAANAAGGITTDDATMTANSVTLNWWNKQWTKRQRISLKTVGETLSNFPLLVVLNTSRFAYADAKADGTDLRFVDQSGVTLLSHYVDTWAVGGTSYIWVKVPSILLNSTTQYVWLYFGKAAATAVSDSSAVWTNGYQHVFTLDSSTADRTANGLTAVANTSSIEPAGKIGAARSFVAANSESISYGNNVGFERTDSFTLQAWVKTSSTAQSPILSKRTNVPPYEGFNMELGGGTPSYLHGYLINNWSGNAIGRYSTDKIVNTDTWKLVTMRYDGTSTHAGLSIFVDGQLASMSNLASGLSGSILTNYNFRIGANEGGGYFNGLIDQATVSNVARSNRWIATEYRSQNDELIASYGFGATINASTSSTTEGGIDLLVGYPTDLTGVHHLKVTRLAGAAAPALGCLNTGGSTTVIDNVTGSGYWESADVTPTIAGYFSYRMCLLDSSNNVIHTATVLNVRSKFTSMFQWTGLGANSSWHTSGNWLGGAVPGSGDYAIFTGGCTQCNATITADISIPGIIMTSAYTGTVTMNNGTNINFSWGGFSQSGGTFIGGSGAITSSNSQFFEFLGGTFRAPALMSIQAGSNANNFTTMKLAAAANFDHNGGTISLTPGTWCGFRLGFVTIDGTHTVNNLSYDGQNGCNGSNTLATYFDGADVLTVAGNFILNNGTMNGALNVAGDVTIATTADGGPMALNFTGGANQTFTNLGGNEPDGLYTINKSGGTLTLASDMQCSAAGQNLTLASGTLNLNGHALSVNGTLQINTGATLTGVGSNVCSAAPCSAGSVVNNGTIQ